MSSKVIFFLMLAAVASGGETLLDMRLLLDLLDPLLLSLGSVPPACQEPLPQVLLAR